MRVSAGYAFARLFAQGVGPETMTVTRQVAEMVTPDLEAKLEARLSEGQKIMVAARASPLRSPLRWRRRNCESDPLRALRQGNRCLLYRGPTIVGRRAKWQDDPEASDNVLT